MVLPGIWSCPARKLDKMDVIELAADRPKLHLHFAWARRENISLRLATCIGYDELPVPLNLSLERGQKIALTGANGIGG